MFLPSFPRSSVTAIKLSRHTGMDRRYPDCRDAPNPAPSLEPGFRQSMPERRCFVNLMAVTLERGNQNNGDIADALGLQSLAPIGSHFSTTNDIEPNDYAKSCQ
ncbi:MAG: hypothetical protein NTX45_30000 [Proteobacteria bacterium]|nr:hypothetical protein [Pseudomonadota bacterium]